MAHKMTLSERLLCFREDKPSDKTMDVFIADAKELEAKLAASRSEVRDADVKIAKWKAKLAHKQFEIDNLMLEYCPDDMTKEQFENWGKYQVPVEMEITEADVVRVIHMRKLRDK